MFYRIVRTLQYQYSRVWTRIWPGASSENLEINKSNIFAKFRFENLNPDAVQIRGQDPTNVTVFLSTFYQILPKLQDLLFDSNESVKLSLIDLLISVKSIKTIQFWQICPLENILDRLMKDKKSVCAKITQLLFNSFFPLDQDDEAKLERCVFLIDHDLDAARYVTIF